jgi:hypothetical protein
MNNFIPSLVHAVQQFLSKPKPAPCQHRHYRESRWVEDGTPMVYFRCLDCPFTDRGHVYGDAEGWEGETVVPREAVA